MFDRPALRRWPFAARSEPARPVVVVAERPGNADALLAAGAAVLLDLARGAAPTPPRPRSSHPSERSNRVALLP